MTSNTTKGRAMNTQLHRHLLIACKAAFYAFSRSSRNGETLDEILGYIDTLTGIPNRKAFEDDRSRISAFQTFIIIDVDNLKKFNDTFGHLFGDKILQSCAHILDTATEKIGKAYRLGGDEFAIIIPQCWVKTVCLYINSAIKEDSRFSISYGIGPTCDAVGLTDDIFKSAEIALYQSKHRELDIYSEFLTDDLTPAPAPAEIYIEDNFVTLPTMAVS
jgi:diguanylate cyclase (GGDEF)-like protein